MKKGADSTGKVMLMWKSGWWFVMAKIRKKPSENNKTCVYSSHAAAGHDSKRSKLNK